MKEFKMLQKYDDSLDITNITYESMYNAVDNERFYENEDADLIYEQLEKISAPFRSGTISSVTFIKNPV